SLQICCENGVAFIDLPSTLIWFDDAGQHSESLDSERPVGEQMLTHFHRAVTSLIRKTSDLDDAYKALTMVTAANESVRDHKRVLLNFE
ncbi:MAG: gfo/Idh/MocA family oxidoreductase, partial [Planctomycetota bacterium]|nr:gfo/Idh/MocA family oxidoreductase [Planctomycetota bacterium]